MDITRLSCNGHSLKDIRDYPLSLITTLCSLLDDIGDIEKADALNLHALAAQGKPESIEKEYKKLTTDK